MAENRETVEVLVRRLPGCDLPLPARSTEWSSGFDLRACVEVPVTIQPGARTLIPTGFCLALSEGWEGQVRPRSGLALEWGLTMLNSPGTIDADYRGEIKVLAINLGESPIVIRRGERIAQLVIARAPRATFREVAELPGTGRGPGGFGHTGSR